MEFFNIEISENFVARAKQYAILKSETTGKTTVVQYNPNGTAVKLTGAEAQAILDRAAKQQKQKK